MIKQITSNHIKNKKKNDKKNDKKSEFREKNYKLYVTIKKSIFYLFIYLSSET